MYHANIKSKESNIIYNNITKQNVIIKVGKRYIFRVEKPTNEKDRKNNERIIEVLGFSDKFMGDVVVRYLDNGRRGRLRGNALIPYE